MTCQNTQDVVFTLTGSRCPQCGRELAASGVDGGSWAHVSTKPDRIVMTEFHNGYMTEHLANGVKIRWKLKRLFS